MCMSVDRDHFCTDHAFESFANVFMKSKIVDVVVHFGYKIGELFTQNYTQNLSKLSTVDF